MGTENKNIFPPEIKAQQKAYEKNTKELVKKYGGDWFERLVGLGLLSKEEVMQIDAQIENEAIEKLKVDPEDKNTKEYLEKLKNSNVILTGSIDEPLSTIFSLPNLDSPVNYSISGTISGKDVGLTAFKRNNNNFIVLGYLGDKEINGDEAEKIFKNYFKIARERMLKILDTIKQNEEKIKENILKEDY